MPHSLAAGWALISVLCFLKRRLCGRRHWWRCVLLRTPFLDRFEDRDTDETPIVGESLVIG
jgi:hypothetical protein